MLHKRSPRYAAAVVTYVKEQTWLEKGAKQIYDELENLKDQETIEDDADIRRKNPLYGLDMPSLKTLQRWHRMIRGNREKAGHSIDAPERWSSETEANPDDARIILSVLAEVATRSQGYTNHFSKGVAAQVLRVTKLAPDVPPYIAWLLAWNYLQAQQDGDTATMEALDLFLGIRPWERSPAFSNYKHLVEKGRITPVPSELLEEIKKMTDLWRTGGGIQL